MRPNHIAAMLAALSVPSIPQQQDLDEVSQARNRAEVDEIYRRGKIAYAQGLVRTRVNMAGLQVRNPSVQAVPGAASARKSSSEDIAMIGMCAMEEMQRFYRNTLDKWPSRAKRIACEPGCAFCCRQQVSCTVPEAAAIAAHLKSGEAVRMACPNAEASRVPLESWVGSLQVVKDVTEGKDAAQWNRDGVRCGFLASYRCGIYNVRPMVCLAHTSVCKADCRRAAGDPTAQVPTPVSPKLEIGMYQFGMADALRRAGLEPMNVDMHRAVLICLQDDSALDRWTAGEPAFASAALSMEGLREAVDLDEIYEESTEEIQAAQERITGRG